MIVRILFFLAHVSQWWTGRCWRCNQKFSAWFTSYEMAPWDTMIRGDYCWPCWAGYRRHRTERRWVIFRSGESWPRAEL